MWITLPPHLRNALVIALFAQKVMHIVIHCLHILANCNQIGDETNAVYAGGDNVCDAIERIE